MTLVVSVEAVRRRNDSRAGQSVSSHVRRVDSVERVVVELRVEAVLAGLVVEHGVLVNVPVGPHGFKRGGWGVKTASRG